MNKLTLYPLEAAEKLVYPESATHLGFESPALAVVTDFQHHKPLILDADTSLQDAEQLMRKAHVRLKLIVGKDSELVGLLTADQLYGEHPLVLVTKGVPRSDITVEQLMRPRKELQCLDYAQVSKATIGDVVDTLQHEGVQHCLVVDHAEKQIRGVISAADIARRLHVDLPVTQRATSFFDIFQALHAA